MNYVIQLPMRYLLPRNYGDVSSVTSTATIKLNINFGSISFQIISQIRFTPSPTYRIEHLFFLSNGKYYQQPWPSAFDRKNILEFE